MTSQERVREYQRQYALKNKEHLREYKREWQNRWRKEHPNAQRIKAKKYTESRKARDPEGYAKMVVDGVRKWRLRNPEKNRAHKKVFVAVRNGSLKKLPCFCGETKVQAHHEDYSKPLDVMWLCKIHHILIHK
jgi:hypothetical protein